MDHVVARRCDGRSYLCAGSDSLGDETVVALAWEERSRGRIASRFAVGAR